MSTSYPNLFQQQKPRATSWNKPISSASLDVLMASSNSTDDEKSTKKKQLETRQSSLKRPAASEETTEVNSALRFTPSQLSNVKKLKQSVEESPSDANTSLTESREKIKLETRLTTSTSSSTSESNTSSSTPVAKSGSASSTESPNSSVYITPESTPTQRRFDAVSRSCGRRSLYGDQSSFNSSSVNCSSYHTPESSPSEFGSSVKRFKTRWSDNRSSYSSDVQDSLNDSCGSMGQGSPAKGGIQPELIGYQMVGDSQFCRFGQQLLGLSRVPTPNSSGRIGICVSGQTITDLHRRIKEKFYPLSDKIILMIGTNDFLKNVDVTTMCKELSALIKTLQETVTNIVLLTLPPIPKLEKKQNIHHFAQLDKYNSFIRSLENGEQLRIADVSPIYMSCPPYQRCRMHLFEMFFNGPAKRYDMIHLNRQGLEVIRKYILDNFL